MTSSLASQLTEEAELVRVQQSIKNPIVRSSRERQKTKIPVG
jgi:hypothetical protein